MGVKETVSPSGTQEPRRPFARSWIEVPGGRLPLWTLGAGPDVLLLHGVSADHTEWRAVARGLAVDHRVLLPDLLGRGVSVPEEDAGFDLGREVERLLVVLDAAGARRPLVAGHSHGASLALALAGHRAVTGLLLASPVTPWTPRPRVLDLLERRPIRRAVEPVLRTCRRPLTRYILTRRVYGERGPHIGDAVERYAAPYADPRRARALLRIFRDWRPAELADLPPPDGLDVRVVTGGADRRIVAGEAARWARRLGAACTVLEGVGHGLTEEAPDRVEAILRDMSAGAPGRTSHGETDEHQERPLDPPDGP